jgi:hypothetical protein
MMVTVSEREKFAILQVFKVLHKVGVQVNDRDQADGAIDLAVIMLEQILDIETNRDELKVKMLAIMLEMGMLEGDATVH